MKGIDFMNEPKPFIQEVTEYISVKRKEKLENAILGEIKERVKDNEHFTTIELNEKAIVEALKKQIPKKVINEPTYTYGDVPYTATCPNCGTGLGYEAQHLYKYCYSCGQFLDWSTHPTEKGGVEE